MGVGGNVLGQLGNGTATKSYVPVRVQFSDSNLAPKISSVPSIWVKQEQDYAYDVDAVDPNDDPLVYSLSRAPSGMEIESTTGVIKWSPTSADIGDHVVEVEVADSDLSDRQKYILTVVDSGSIMDPAIVPGAWSPLGASGIVGNSTGQMRMLLNPTGVPYVVFADGEENDRLTVTRFVNDNWESVSTSGTANGTVSDIVASFDDTGDLLVASLEGTLGSKKIVVRKYYVSNSDYGDGSDGVFTAGEIDRSRDYDFSSIDMAAGSEMTFSGTGNGVIRVAGDVHVGDGAIIRLRQFEHENLDPIVFLGETRDLTPMPATGGGAAGIYGRGGDPTGARGGRGGRAGYNGEDGKGNGVGDWQPGAGGIYPSGDGGNGSKYDGRHFGGGGGGAGGAGGDGSRVYVFQSGTHDI
jgi:hypothetical protein